MEEQTQKNILYELYYDKKKGFQNLKSLLADTKIFGMKPEFVKEWYRQQNVNQILNNRKQKIAFHKIIGDGHGYQADIIFLPHVRENEGYIGLLTLINTSTRYAYIALIRNRSTEEIYNKIEVWIDHVERTWGKIHSITTDN